MTSVRELLLLAAVLSGGHALPPAPAAEPGQTPRVMADDEWCRDEGDGDRRTEGFCEVREFTFARPGLVRIVDSPNGSISVTGGSRSDVFLRARVAARAATAAEARQLAAGVQIAVSDGQVTTTGPQTSGRTSWWVSYRVETPRSQDLALETANGAVSVTDVSGTIDVSSANGSLRLSGVAGRVRGRTSNGSVHVALSGSAWSGEGLDVSSANGSVSLDVPSSYSARLVARTQNGRLRSDVPGATPDRRANSIDAAVGSGGPTIRVETSNGSVTLRQRSGQ
jgi:hypothetical protein